MGGSLIRYHGIVVDDAAVRAHERVLLEHQRCPINGVNAKYGSQRDSRWIHNEFNKKREQWDVHVREWHESGRRGKRGTVPDNHRLMSMNGGLT